MQDLAGKTAFVSGAASGIGLGLARQLLRAGANVALADIRQEALDDACRQLGNYPGRAISVVVDVSDRASLERAADEIERQFGDIHLVFNNAGVAMHGVPVAEIAPEDWQWVIDVNVNGVINGIQTFVPRLKRHGKGGHVVNTASIGGLQVNPDFLTGAYSMTKYAVVALSEALEQELDGSGIGVSVLCPAAVNTGIHLSERSRPERFGGATVREQNHFVGDLIKEGLSGDEVGARVLHAVENGEFFIFTHTEPRIWIDKRHQRISEAFDRAEAYNRSRIAGREDDGAPPN